MDLSMLRRVRLALAVGPVLALAAVAMADESPSPAVLAYERFSRVPASSPGHLPARRAGRLLIGELGCAACHRAPDEDLAPKPGPDLAGVGLRIDAAWLAKFLADPAAAAPGTTMPHVLAGVPAAQRADVIGPLAAYLATLRQEVPLPKPSGVNPLPPAFWERGTEATGRTLYHRVGCVACHDPLPGHAGRGGLTAIEARAADLDAAGLDADDRAAVGLPLPEAPFRSVPLAHIARKYTRRGLAEFLLVPLHARPAGRMPDMKLKAIEAADIATAFFAASDTGLVPASKTGLVPASNTGLPPASGVPAASAASGSPDDDLVARGRTAFVTRGCSACHATNGPTAPVPAKALADLDAEATNSCIATLPATHDRAGGTGPVHYPLDAGQRAAIVTALRDDPPALQPTALEATIQRLNCLACHEQGGRGGVGPGRTAFFETLGQVDLGDEGRLPPRLDGVGARLIPAWFAKVLDGTGTIRPFMLARMPIYPPAATKPLPGLFAGSDHPPPPGAPQPLPLPADPRDHDAVFAAAARILDTGCIQCHALGDHALPGVVGVNLADVTKRVEPAWFRRLLLHPQDVRPLTKMPAFFGDTRDRALLDGDPERQVAAVWHWLDRKGPTPLPARILAAVASDLELVPTDRPIVFRTFMTRAGTHAVAVGFPAGVHIAFDAEHCRIAEAWRGRFLDARGTWVLAKSAPPTDPLGTPVVPIDVGPSVARRADPADPWPADVPATFAGYALDEGGVPTFRWRLDGDVVRERVEPADGGLTRRIGLAPPSAAATASASPLVVRLAAGPDVEVRVAADGWQAVTRPDGLVVSVAAAAGATLRDLPGAGREWLVPLPADGGTVEVRYRW